MTVLINHSHNGSKQPTTSATYIIKDSSLFRPAVPTIIFYKYNSQARLEVEHNNVILLNDSAEGLIIS